MISLEHPAIDTLPQHPSGVRAAALVNELSEAKRAMQLARVAQRPTANDWRSWTRGRVVPAG